MNDGNKAGRTERLEEEGELAADYLEELLDIADFDGDIEIDIENDRASVAVIQESDDGGLDRLVGTNGEVLDALQELTRLAVQTATGERSRLMLDIADFRKNRKAELRAITEEAVIRVQTHEKPVRLDPMNPFERKVCHDVVAAAGLVSESEGSEPDRRVVILLPAREEAALDDSVQVEPDSPEDDE